MPLGDPKYYGKIIIRLRVVRKDCYILYLVIYKIWFGLKYYFDPAVMQEFQNFTENYNSIKTGKTNCCLIC